MTLAITIVVSIAVVAVAAIIFGRPLTLSYKGMQASVEQTERHVEAIKNTVGVINGNGDLVGLAERLLGESAETKAELAEVRRQLQRRTQVTRVGSDEPEDLAPYTQDRMHDVLSAIAVLSLQVQTVWRFLKDDYDLPDLPSTEEPQ